MAIVYDGSDGFDFHGISHVKAGLIALQMMKFFGQRSFEQFGVVNSFRELYINVLGTTYMKDFKRRDWPCFDDFIIEALLTMLT